MKLYLDHTPASADSSKKLPGFEDANFSKIVNGVSVPENTDSTIGITWKDLESSTNSTLEITLAPGLGCYWKRHCLVWQ
jgi:hypothetical protein